MAFGLDSIISWAKNNMLLIVVILIAIIIIVWIFGRSKKKELKPINRARIEFIRYWEDLELNKSIYNNLYRGNEWLGKIDKIRTRTDLSAFVKNPNDERIAVFEIGYKPSLINTGFFKLHNPFKKNMVIVAIKNCYNDKAGKYIEIIETTEFEKESLNLVNIDRELREEIHNYIRIEHLHSTDLNAMASVYYAKAQEQSTIRPEYAHDMAMAEKELQTELAKKRGKQSTI